MQKLRPCVLPGLFVFQLVVLYVLLTTVPTEKGNLPGACYRHPCAAVFPDCVVCWTGCLLDRLFAGSVVCWIGSKLKPYGKVRLTPFLDVRLPGIV
jgi:hypothetical protein